MKESISSTKIHVTEHCKNLTIAGDDSVNTIKGYAFSHVGSLAVCDRLRVVPCDHAFDTLSTSMSLHSSLEKDLDSLLDGAAMISRMPSPGGLEIDSLLQEGSDREKIEGDWRNIGGEIQRAIETTLSK